ncbi:MAG TPA: universal stress protein [Methylomirabilota bacterium]|nr:universal stress protein [Methylomirabilota bacterium]
MKRVLVATDFSTRSDRALRRATLIAKAATAELSLLHVLDEDLPERLIAAERPVAEDLLADLARTVRSVDGIACTATVRVGEPFEVIAGEAAARPADLVVIGPHRRKSLRDVFVGTTAERTISRTPAPVLMANGVPAKPYGRMAVATEFSAGSDAALAAAVRLGLVDPAATAVVHVLDAPAEGLVSLAGGGASRDEYVAEEEARAQADLAAFVGRHALAIDDRRVRVNRSSASAEILDVAKEAGADLLVLGREGRSALDRLVLGSVVGEVLRRAEMDVLVVPPR